MSTKVYTQQEVKEALMECLYDNLQCKNFYEEEGNKQMEDMYWSACEAIQIVANTLGNNLRKGE